MDLTIETFAAAVPASGRRCWCCASTLPPPQQSPSAKRPSYSPNRSRIRRAQSAPSSHRSTSAGAQRRPGAATRRCPWRGSHGGRGAVVTVGRVIVPARPRGRSPAVVSRDGAASRPLVSGAIAPLRQANGPHTRGPATGRASAVPSTRAVEADPDPHLRRPFDAWGARVTASLRVGPRHASRRSRFRATR
jgi:hypothetical protein